MVEFGDLSACANCGSKTGNLNRCTRCASQAYCNTECQRAHYKQHKAQCKAAAAGRTRAARKNPPATSNNKPQSQRQSKPNVQCLNADKNRSETLEPDDDLPNLIVPEIDIAFNMGSRKPEYVLTYSDDRPGRPGMGQESSLRKINMMTRQVQQGIVNKISFRLVPVDVDNVPKLPPPRGMIVGCEIPAVDEHGRTKEELTAIVLNSYNVRHFVHKEKQEKYNNLS